MRTLNLIWSTQFATTNVIKNTMNTKVATCATNVNTNVAATNNAKVAITAYNNDIAITTTNGSKPKYFKLKKNMRRSQQLKNVWHSKNNKLVAGLLFITVITKAEQQEVCA